MMFAIAQARLQGRRKIREKFDLYVTCGKEELRLPLPPQLRIPCTHRNTLNSSSSFRVNQNL